jgi:acetyl esterase/lipase
MALGGLAVSLLGGCSGLRLIDAVTPSAGYTLAAGLAYGPSQRHLLDIYAPLAGGAAGPPPVVLFLYGGSWRNGARAQYRFVGAWLARAGFVAAVADYRLFPEVRFPGFVEDCAAALAFLGRHAGQHGGDPGRLFLMGHSAGAHMAMLLAIEPAYLVGAGADPDRLAGVVGISGPYDHDFGTVRWLADVFPDDWSRRAARVADRARSGTPPVFLANGMADSLVPARNAVVMAERLRQKGNPVALRLYDGAGHGDILLGFVPALAGASTLGQDVAGFLNQAAMAKSEGAPGSLRTPL